MDDGLGSINLDDYINYSQPLAKEDMPLIKPQSSDIFDEKGER